MDPQILLGLQNSLRDIHSVKANSIFIWVALKTLDAKLAAAADDVEVELSQQMGDLTSPSKPPAPKKPKDGVGDGGSASQAIEFSQ